MSKSIWGKFISLFLPRRSPGTQLLAELGLSAPPAPDVVPETRPRITAEELYLSGIIRFAGEDTFALLQQPSKARQPDRDYKLGLCCYHGFCGATQDVEKAMQLFASAAEGDNCAASYTLYLLSGDVRHLKVAAHNGHAAAMLEYGLYLQQQPYLAHKAERYLQQAVAHQYPGAQTLYAAAVALRQRHQKDH